MRDDHRIVRCAIYTRKSVSEGLEQAFNTLDAQREAAEAFIASQQHEGWVCLPDRYDDGGFTGGNLERPNLKRLMTDIEAGRVDCVVTYKVDRLSRSLLDFARLMETFEKHSVRFVSVTQSFSTADSMGRLTLNILLSFAQFEREIISERTRDKIAASRRRGMWIGGQPMLGYDIDRPVTGSRLVVNRDEATQVRAIFDLYVELGSIMPVVKELALRDWRMKRWTTRAGRESGGRPHNKGSLHRMLTNPIYIGKVTYRDEIHEGQHDAIIPPEVWESVQKRLKQNAHTGSGTQRNRHGALLRGLLHCTHCHCGMTHAYTGKDNKRYRYYVCTHAQKNGWHTCPSKSVPAHEIESFVVAQIRCVGRDPGVLAETIEQARSQVRKRIDELQSEHGILHRQLERDQAALQKEASADHLVDLHDRIGRAERRLTELNAELETARSELVTDGEVREALTDFDPVWDALTTNERCDLMKLLVDRVEYDGAASTVSITFHPTGIRALAQQTSDKEVAA